MRSMAHIAAMLTAAVLSACIGGKGTTASAPPRTPLVTADATNCAHALTVVTAAESGLVRPEREKSS